MANKLIEKVLTDIKTILIAGMGAELAALQLAYNDGIVLDAPKSRNYAISPVEQRAQFPFVEILPDTSPIELNNQIWDEMDHSVIIIIHASSRYGEPEKCSKRVYRYVEAIWRILKNNIRLEIAGSPTCIESFFTALDYTEMLTDGNFMTQEGWLRLTVKKEERV